MKKISLYYFWKWQ